jgi:hypothetical protein
MNEPIWHPPDGIGSGGGKPLADRSMFAVADRGNGFSAFGPYPDRDDMKPKRLAILGTGSGMGFGNLLGDGKT